MIQELFVATLTLIYPGKIRFYSSSPKLFRINFSKKKNILKEKLNR